MTTKPLSETHPSLLHHAWRWECRTDGMHLFDVDTDTEVKETDLNAFTAIEIQKHTLDRQVVRDAIYNMVIDQDVNGCVAKHVLKIMRKLGLDGE